MKQHRGSYRTVLHHNARVGAKKLFKRQNYTAHVVLVFVIVQLPLGVEDIVHCDQVVLRENKLMRTTGNPKLKSKLHSTERGE